MYGRGSMTEKAGTEFEKYIQGPNQDMVIQVDVTSKEEETHRF